MLNCHEKKALFYFILFKKIYNFLFLSFDLGRKYDLEIFLKGFTILPILYMHCASSPYSTFTISYKSK